MYISNVPLCKVCGNRLKITKLEQRLYCKQCGEYKDIRAELIEYENKRIKGLGRILC